MTYGWVMLVLLIIIAALSLFYQSQKVKQEICIMEPGFYCKEFRVYSNGIFFVIQNNKGYDIQNVRLTIGSSSLICYQTNSVTSILDGQSANFYLSCSSGINVNKNFRANINMTYSKLAVNSLERRTEVVIRSVAESEKIPAARLFAAVAPACADVYLNNLQNKVGNTCGLGWVEFIVAPEQFHTIIAMNGSLQGSVNVGPYSSGYIGSPILITMS